MKTKTETTKDVSMWIQIQNKGTDLVEEAFTLLGGTTKKDGNSIGQFGSGNKFSPAFLLRNNIAFRVFAGEKEIVFSTVPKQLREDTFQCIVVNGIESSITTDAGAGGEGWEHWFVIREFLSNAIDESSEWSIDLSPHCFPVQGYTSVYIEATPEFMEIFNNMDKYFSFYRPKTWKDNTITLFNSRESLNVYRQGIMVHSDDMKALYDYDFKSIKINEFRKAERHEAMKKIRDWWIKDAPKHLIEHLIDNLKEKKYIESNLYWNSAWSISFNSAWRELFEGKNVIENDDLIIQFMMHDVDENTIVLPKSLCTALVSADITKWAGNRKASYDELMLDDDPDEYHDALYKRALEFFHESKYEVKYPVQWVKFQNNNILGHAKGDTIYISTRIDSLQKLVETIVEENEHLITSYADETREFQQHFINLFIEEKKKRFGFLF